MPRGGGGRGDVYCRTGAESQVVCHSIVLSWMRCCDSHVTKASPASARSGIAPSSTRITLALEWTLELRSMRFQNICIVTATLDDMALCEGVVEKVATLSNPTALGRAAISHAAGSVFFRRNTMMRFAGASWRLRHTLQGGEGEGCR